MQVGIGSFGVAWSFGVAGYPSERPLTLGGFLERAAAWGYQGVQLADNTPLLEQSAAELAQLRVRAAELGLFLEIGGRGLTPENLALHLQVAHALGARLLRFVIDAPGFEPDPAVIPGILAEATDRCADAGICLAIENHDRFAAGQFHQWVRAIDNSYLGICLDSVNSFGCGEGFQVTLDSLIPDTCNFHLKDFTIRRQPHQMGFLIEGTPAGEGMLPLRETIRRLQAIGRCQTVIVEHWPPFLTNVATTIRNEQDWCERSRVNLREQAGL